MTCPGLHCPGCSEGQTLGIAAGLVVGLAVACEMVQWVADRIWWIGSTAAVCLALAVAASMWLERRADRRGARYAAEHGILSRADVILPHPVTRHAVADHEIREPLTDSGRAAIGPPQVVFNFYGPLDAGQAAIIRQALPEGGDHDDG